jgi:hypothetical protein
LSVLFRIFVNAAFRLRSGDASANQCHVLEARAQIAFEKHDLAKDLLREILRRDPRHLLAADLLREISADASAEPIRASVM